MRFIILFITLINIGCATMIRGTEEVININTNVKQAKIKLSDGQICVTPCSLQVKRDQHLEVTAEKDGCTTKVASMTPSITSEGFLYSGVIDYANGAAYDLKPNPLIIHLECVN